MRIAFVSYEYAGGTRTGGIGTYVRNAAAMLATRGHDVHVFTANAQVAASAGMTVHSVQSDHAGFATAVCPIFDAVQMQTPFDVVEGAEYRVDTAAVAAAHPEVPLVVKLHGPSFTIQASNARNVSILAKARFFAGGLRRGYWPQNPWRYDRDADLERAHALAADLVLANSEATAARVARAWSLPRARLTVVRNPFQPPTSLLNLAPESGDELVLFIGRLEVRKGVLDLARAIPLVLRRRPGVRFRFVGADLPHPQDGVPLSTHIRRIVAPHHKALEFVGAVSYEDVPAHYADTSVAVFPSDWEASGFVCLEAMSAARGVICSSAGGMAEIIENGRTGCLVPPRDKRAISEAILFLLAHSEQRITMGRAARAHVVTAYAPEVIGPLQEAAYERAITHARRRAARNWEPTG